MVEEFVKEATKKLEDDNFCPGPRMHAFGKQVLTPQVPRHNVGPMWVGFAVNALLAYVVILVMGWLGFMWFVCFLALCFVTWSTCTTKFSFLSGLDYARGLVNYVLLKRVGTRYLINIANGKDIPNA